MLLSYYILILLLWSGAILSRKSDENEYMASNAIAEKYFRIVKQPIMEDKASTRASHFIRTMYVNIDDRVSALNLVFTLRLHNYINLGSGS